MCACKQQIRDSFREFYCTGAEKQWALEKGLTVEEKLLLAKAMSCGTMCVC